MRLYACYTPSHQAMAERHFLPSLPDVDWPRRYGRAPRQDTGIILRELPQRSTTGAFKSAGFHLTCLEKVDFIIEALSRETDPFLFSDVDVRFYGPVADDLTKLLGDSDMAFQWDGSIGRECTGFMVLRPSDRTKRFWAEVRSAMVVSRLLDQDAAHAVIERGTSLARCHTLPERYWTFGHNDQHWEPGMAVNPPADLLVHHANWTVGVENKMALLEAVREHASAQALLPRKPRAFGVAERSFVAAPSTERMLPYSEVTRMLDDQRASLTKAAAWHHPLPLALVLQFWKGDKRRALDLARLLADIEPVPREDVLFVFARQSNCPMDREIAEAMQYAGQRFDVMGIETAVDERKRYPGVCFDPWASACDQLADGYYNGRLPCANAFFFEADGTPLRPTWIDDIKREHEETLKAGKRVTGPIMRYGGTDRLHAPCGHVNGSLVMHLSCWLDHPALHRCGPRDAWDVFAGPVLVNEARPSNIIRNEHGMLGVTENQFWILAKESAFLVSVKDGTPAHWLRRYVEQTRAA